VAAGTHGAGPSDESDVAGGSGGGEQEPLSEIFWGVARQLRQLSRQTLAPWDMAPSHSRALGVLLDHGVMRLSELSDHLHIAPRSTTEVVDGLQDRGLIERRPDPNDRRATLVALTGQGDRVGTAIRGARAAEAEAFFGVLDRVDRLELARLLGQLRR
jgi:DNA-binding MarR family transcriptional regulator